MINLLRILCAGTNARKRKRGDKASMPASGLPQPLPCPAVSARLPPEWVVLAVFLPRGSHTAENVFVNTQLKADAIKQANNERSRCAYSIFVNSHAVCEIFL